MIPRRALTIDSALCPQCGSILSWYCAPSDSGGSGFAHCRNGRYVSGRSAGRSGRVARMTADPLLVALIRASAEQWAPLPPEGEFAWASRGYWVSTEGRVVQVNPRLPPGRRLRIKALRVERKRGRRPHLRTNLHEIEGGRRADRAVRVHRLVAAAWLPILGGYLVRHANGDGLDNRVANLLRGTDSENLRDAYVHGARGAHRSPNPGPDTPPPF